MSSIVIFGSSASTGKTRDFIDSAIQDKNIELIDLKEHNISPFDYEHKNKNDDFNMIIDKVLACDHIILASPVYWYSMSAHMKMFLDRITDLLVFYPEKYEKLKGKKMSVITAYASSSAKPEGFEYPFSQTCEYIGMKYNGCSYFYTGKEKEVLKKNEQVMTQLKAIIASSE